ncbi:MarR family winged helix-turn-helix transcriptional regulator [Cryptosporangium aurantiacum]|nr:MarR family transcriptional regulator [Cryptosporangium aurantiacum]
MTTPADPAAPADSSPAIAAFDLVLQFTVLMSEDLTQGLARHNLSESRVHLMWVLAAQGPSTQKSLAEAMHVSARNITGLVDGLVATGFVTREPHPGDRRATLVTMTEHGTETVKSLQDGQRDAAEQLFGPMPPDELTNFLKSMSGVLDRLRAALAAAEEGGNP